MIDSGVIFAIIRDNKVLMQQRDEHCSRFPFMWCIPGGGCEENETYEEALIREVKEEYNIDIKSHQYTFIMDYRDQGDPLRVYVCKIDEDQEPELREGLDMRWMTFDEITKLKLGFDQAGILPVLRPYLL